MTAEGAVRPAAVAAQLAAQGFDLVARAERSNAGEHLQRAEQQLQRGDELLDLPKHLLLRRGRPGLSEE